MSNPGPAVTTTSTQFLTPAARSGGYVMGQSATDLIGFYGLATGLAQQANTVDAIQQLINLNLLPAGSSVFANGAPVNITAAGALTAAANGNRINTVNSAAGIALTLPAATGSGTRFRLYIGTTVTSSATTITPNGSDKLVGNAFQTGATGAATNFYAAAGASLSFNGTTRGGIKGDYVDLEDVATAVWSTRVLGSITSTAATPFT